MRGERERTALTDCAWKRRIPSSQLLSLQVLPSELLFRVVARDVHKSPFGHQQLMVNQRAFRVSWRIDLYP